MSRSLSIQTAIPRERRPGVPKSGEVRVPANDSGVIPDSAFYAVPGLRHVLVEEGLHTVGVLAWQNCRQLRIVKLPATVVRIEESSFQGCYLLGRVDAPGCINFGYRAFAECCSLQHIGASGGDNTFTAATKLAPYLFASCLNLSSIALTQASVELGQSTTLSTFREIPQGCFGSSGLRDLKFPPGISLLGPLACDNWQTPCFR